MPQIDGMSKDIPIKLLALALLTSLLVACVPATVVLERGADVPTPRHGAPIYITATPFVSEWNDLSYDDIRQVSQIVRFTDTVKGQPLVCYYAYYAGGLEMSCVALCDCGEDE